MLESYIAPILMGYVSKYIKNLRPSDLSLSVWGGDVVLQNLELNLDVLQTVNITSTLFLTLSLIRITGFRSFQTVLLLPKMQGR